MTNNSAPPLTKSPTKNNYDHNPSPHAGANKKGEQPKATPGAFVGWGGGAGATDNRTGTFGSNILSGVMI